jgi:transcriptional regulator with XRE-family HTH domain
MPQRHDEEIAKEFGLNLVAARRRGGLSQSRLAERAGLSRDGIHKIEHGYRSPRIDSLILIAAALGVEPATLLRGL